MTAEIPLARDVRSPHVARRHVTDVLTHSSFSPRCVETAVLLVSELVTNAIVHATGDVRLACVVDGTVARIGVTDGDHSFPPTPERAADAPGGRGLKLVERLAHRWGVERTEKGKTVWFEIAQ